MPERTPGYIRSHILRIRALISFSGKCLSNRLFMTDADATPSLSLPQISFISPIREIMVISIVIISAGIIGGTALIIATGLPLLWIGLGGLACNSRKPDNGGHPARQQYPRHRHGHPLADPHCPHCLWTEDSQSHLLQGFFQRQERLSETTGYVPAVHTVLSVVQGRDIPCPAV